MGREKVKILLKFYRIARSYSLRDFYEICKVCIYF